MNPKVRVRAKYIFYFFVALVALFVALSIFDSPENLSNNALRTGGRFVQRVTMNPKTVVSFGGALVLGIWTFIAVVSWREQQNNDK